jgi:CubicO group peptidase (beta-lactamase class C family)
METTMRPISRAWLASGALAFCGLAAGLAPTSAMASTTLQVMSGSGDFKHLDSWISVEQPKDLQMYWTTDQLGSTAGTWQVTTSTCLRCLPVVVASGEAKITSSTRTSVYQQWFTIPSDAFLKSPYAQTPLTFNVTITPHDSAFQSLGSTSPAVTVYQYPPSGGITFDDSGNYPKVDILTYKEYLGGNIAGADLTVRVSNKSGSATLASWLSLKDDHVLMKQSTPKLSVPSLAPGASQVFAVHLDAVPPIDQKLSTWQQQYKDDCGVQLASLLEYAGPLNQAPLTTEVQAPLVKEGWSDYANVGVSSTICNGKQCINVCKLEKDIRSRLDGHVVGYSFFAGQYPHFASGGLARTFADGGEQPFDSTTKLTVGSVSKFVTAVGTMAVLDKYGVSVDSAIGPYLPSDWSGASDFVKNLTFAQLLSQTTGIKTYGNKPQTYAELKTFYTQAVNNSAVTACPFNTTTISVNPIAPANMGYCYSNYNFAILRILLPKVAGYPEDANQATRPQTLADNFQKLVRQNVFDKVGQPDVSCKPPTVNPGASTYAWAHVFPGSSFGYDWHDESLVCGAASWYLSTEDLAKVVMSLNAKDGKILKTVPDRFAEMRTRLFGFDRPAGFDGASDTNTEVEKNGGWTGPGSEVISTSVAVFGPVKGPRVLAMLFLDSDISGGPNAGAAAQAVLEQAYKAALYTLP